MKAEFAWGASAFQPESWTPCDTWESVRREAACATLKVEVSQAVHF